MKQRPNNLPTLLLLAGSILGSCATAGPLADQYSRQFEAQDAVRRQMGKYI
jgi:hypothetical protein